MSQSQKIKSFILYSLCYFIYGLVFSGIGPLIPYLADHLEINQTQFSYLFSVRAVGMMTGVLIFKNIPENYKQERHLLMFISSFATALFLMIFLVSTSNIHLGICQFYNGIFFALLESSINFSIMKICNIGNIQFWYTIINCLFGCGGLAGPLAVKYFELNIFFIFGFLMLVISPFFIIIKQPYPTAAESISSQNILQKIQSKENLPYQASKYLNILLVVYMGLICTIGGWASSYAVLKGIDSKQDAVIYPTLFWSFLTASRLSFAFITGSSKIKMISTLFTILIVSIVSLGIQLNGQTKFSLYFLNICMGVAISPYYPAIYSISKQYEYELSSDQIGNLVGAGTIGQGVLTMICGWLMQSFSEDMFYGSIIIFISTLIWGQYTYLSIVEAKKKSLVLSNKEELQLK